MQTDRPDGMTIAASAEWVGVHQFSLLARIQTDEILFNRARSGELLIPVSELERLSPDSANRETSSPENNRLSDQRLGIERVRSKLKYQGELPARFTVPTYDGQFGVVEAESYRAAYGAIARDMESASKLKAQLDDPAKVAAVPERKIGHWHVRATLLNLGSSDVLLCERGQNEFAVVERFQEGSPFARTQGQSHILLEGIESAPLVETFKGNARHTLAFLASNAVTTAQKIVWEQFPNDRPGHVVGSISERCRQAVAQKQAVSQNPQEPQAMSRGVII